MGLLNASQGMQEMDLDLYFDVQHTIEVDSEKKYRVDFILSMYDVIFADENTPFTDWETQLIVECDGWDFHSTKEQVSDDNNRDAEILAAYGIPTIRFLGKEINANPFACAKKALDTIKGMHALEKRQHQQTVKWTRELALQKRMARLREQTVGERK
jgi:very-short-patch-repair endonuclease